MGTVAVCASAPVFTPTLRCCRFFGWTKANEINNGRWVMFGFAVGLLTEFATGARQLVFPVKNFSCHPTSQLIGSNTYAPLSDGR